MIAYIDTSALAKSYLEEVGSRHLDSLLIEIEHLETSVFTELELIASIERAKATRRIDSPAYRNITHRMEQDIQNGKISLTQVETIIWKTAKRLIKQRRLRFGDAIQLACALDARKRLGDSMQFLCADRSLLEAARLEGLHCRDLSRD
ncbi:MAG: type II toxin-antitoxin system VapC family toxin [Deltaproteobacteria bacterium]|nr:type II toxin-antitoxin system VapC family toxin [Deltaproteobacteria bacterium]